MGTVKLCCIVVLRQDNFDLSRQFFNEAVVTCCTLFLMRNIVIGQLWPVAALSSLTEHHVVIQLNTCCFDGTVSFWVLSVSRPPPCYRSRT